jgi:signal transduction histidine kinase
MNRSKKLGTAFIPVLWFLILSIYVFTQNTNQPANQATSEPRVEFSRIPDAEQGGGGKLAVISGRVYGAAPGQRIVLFARSGDRWYVQPFVGQPFTEIGADSSWSNSTHLGEEYAALLVEPSYVPPTKRTDELPHIGDGVLAIAITKGVPPFWTTVWFQGGVAITGFLVIYWLYRIRVRQLERRANILFDERLAERTRVAREIHDTFLQTVQGSKLVADHALKNRNDHDLMLRAMQQLSNWLGQATEEGRAALNSLRSSSTEINDLAAAFRLAIDDCRMQTSAEVSFSVRGESQKMHSVASDEIYRVGYEAIRNACAHANGDHVDITLDCSRDLTFSVHDDGVGIDPKVAQKGKDGHFGLKGMKERAERLDGKLTVVSSHGSGTIVTLIVPGRIAFNSLPPSLSERIRSAFKI